MSLLDKLGEISGRSALAEKGGAGEKRKGGPMRKQASMA